METQSVTINGIKTSTLNLKKGEAKTVRWTLDTSLAGATFKIVVTDLNNTTKITKNDADFDKSDIANHRVSIFLSATDLNLAAGVYKMELKSTFVDGTIDISPTIKINLESSNV